MAKTGSRSDMEEVFISTHVCREAMSLYSRSDRSGILDSARLRSFRRSSQIQSQVPCIGTFGRINRISMWTYLTSV